MALGDITAELLAFINDALQQSYSAVTDTELINALKAAVNKMSDDRLYIVTQTETVAADSDTVDHPSDFKATIELTPLTTGGSRYENLRKLQGGITRWKQLRDADTSRGVPESYVDHMGKWYLWPVPGSEIQLEEDYFALHPVSGSNWYSNLLFEEKCKTAVLYCTAYMRAKLSRRADDAAVWGAEYEMLKIGLQTEMHARAAVVGR